MPDCSCQTGSAVCTGNSNTDSFLQPMPWILEMSVNPNNTLRDESCLHCEGNNPLGAMCCGMCAFWVSASIYEDLYISHVHRRYMRFR